MSDRYLRQQDFVPPEKLATCKVTIIGTGAIGRQVALQLTAMGVSDLRLVDFDKVEEVNMGSQGFMEEDLGMLKVEAVGKLCKRINSQCTLRLNKDEFTNKTATDNVVFCCVDSIDTRKFIWEIMQERKYEFFVDTRMNGEVMRIISAYDDKSKAHYPTTIFQAAEAVRGQCTAKTTLYASNICAGLAITQFAQWLRGHKPAKDLYLNMFTNELILDPEA